MRGFANRLVSASALAAGLLTVAVGARGADLSLPVTGNLLGSVLDAAGTPQMGATVQLVNKFERVVAKARTSPDGRFGFSGLPIDTYSVRVSGTNFLPTSRDHIRVKPGLDSILQIHLATLLSSIEVHYAVPAAAMTDDWKWVLRSSSATRPINRYLPKLEQASSSSGSGALFPHIFSGTHAMVSLSGGESSTIDADTPPSGFGTGFILSTSILGKNQLQIGGSLGQNSAWAPAAIGLCAIYTRSSDNGLGQAPELTFTVSQFGITPGENLSPQNGPGVLNATPLRTMSMSVYQVLDPTDNIHLEYGGTAESVSYLQQTSRISPFARITVSAGQIGEFISSYSDGGRPDELAAHMPGHSPEQEAVQADDMTTAVNTLSRTPQVSYGRGQLQLQRSQNFEMGYRKTAGSNTLAVSVFREYVSNGRIDVTGDTAAINPGDLLSDGVSDMQIYNVGRYQRNGMLASVNQHFNNMLDAGIAYGRMGGFTLDDWDGGAASNRKFLDPHSHNMANASLQLRAPRSGTRIIANYGWTESNAVVPQHLFTTQNTYVAPGLNVLIRQPLPSPFGVPGHFALTADLRNLLAQGYLPISSGDGHTLLVVQAPRAIRGGLSIVF